MNIHDTEQESLLLLANAQAELASALKSLSGKSFGLVENYIGYTVRLANQAIDSFIELRRIERLSGSKLLIRPAIEAAIRVTAIKKKPELLFRVAFTEYQEDKKWAAATNPTLPLSGIDQNWDDFKKAFSGSYPTHPQVETKISSWELADAAGFRSFYESHYRMYCQFTHGALRASTGSLDDLTEGDNRTMSLCCIASIEALVAIGAEAPNLRSLFDRLPPITNP